MGLFFDNNNSNSKSLDMVCCWCGKWTQSSVMFTSNGVLFVPTKEEIKMQIQRKEGVFCSPRCIVEYRNYRKEHDKQKQENNNQ